MCPQKLFSAYFVVPYDTAYTCPSDVYILPVKRIEIGQNVTTKSS
jgi:hypothetical protein